MAQFFTDFTEYPIGMPPAGWTQRWQPVGGAWTVVEEADARGGVALQEETTTGTRRLFTWDDVGVVDHVEIVARFRTFTSGELGYWSQCRFYAFGSGTQASPNGYYAEMVMGEPGTTGLAFLGYENGIGFGIAPFYFTPLQTHRWYKIRFQATTTQQRARIWPADQIEPAEWHAQGSQTRFASGMIGIGAQHIGVRQIDWIAVGTDGDEAPDPEKPPEKTAYFDGIEIPLVYAYQTARQLIADKRRTVGGRMRMDVVAAKRQWTLQTRPMPKAHRDAILDYLRSINYQAGDFILTELGHTPIRALMMVQDDRRDVSHPDRHSLTLLVMEE